MALSVDSEVDPDITTPAQLTVSVNGPAADCIANDLSADNGGGPIHEKSPRHRSPIPGERADDESLSARPFADNGGSNESNSPVASSYTLTVDLPSKSNVLDGLNSFLRPSFRFPSSVTDARPVEEDVTRDPPGVSAIGDSSSFDAFSRYVQGTPERRDNESYKPEESLKPEVCGVGPGETTTTEPTCLTPVHGTSRDVIRMSKIDEILKSESKSARVAKALESRKRTGQLPRALQTRLGERYSDLFGDDHDRESDPLTEKEERIVSYRRVVNMVVGFMNPYYAARRINKRLFKDLAKTITNKLMRQSFDPGILIFKSS